MAYTISLRILNSPEDAEDSAQESFIKVFTQLGQFQGRSKFSTWLYTIVYRTALSKLSERKVNTLSIRRIDEDIAAVTEQHHDEREEKLIRDAIQRLPSEEALVITLYYMNENNIGEIHDITGLSVPNIKIKLFRARGRLEKELRVLLQRSSNKTAGNGNKA